MAEQEKKTTQELLEWIACEQIWASCWMEVLKPYLEEILGMYLEQA